MKLYIYRSSLLLKLAASFFIFTILVLSPKCGEAAWSPKSGKAAWSPSGGKAAVSISPQEKIPCVFDNFVWFKDQEIIDEIRKDLPSFDGTTTGGDSIEKILGALKRMLKAQNLPSEIDYKFYSGDGFESRTAHIFTVRYARVTVGKIVFQNSPPQVENDLQQAVAGLINKAYSKVLTIGFVEGNAVAVYRKYGYLRASAHVVSVDLDKTDKDNVVVQVAAEPGISYVWDKAVWMGAQAISPQSLNGAIDLKTGEVADGFKLDTALRAAYIVYQKLGYVEAQIIPKPVFDDAKKQISLEVAITEGAQYHMGEFIVKGVPEKDAMRLKERWTLKTGDIYDASYLGDFINKLVEDKLILPSMAKLLKTEPKLDKQKMLVDVIIDFNVSSVESAH